jgi:hypothetical protein
MSTAFEKQLSRVAATWRAVTGESLTGWKGTRAAGLPEGLQDFAVQMRGQTGRFECEGQAWIVARSQLAPAPFYLASRNPGGASADLLGLLDRVFPVYDTVEQAFEGMGNAAPAA